MNQKDLSNSLIPHSNPFSSLSNTNIAGMPDDIRTFQGWGMKVAAKLTQSINKVGLEKTKDLFLAKLNKLEKKYRKLSRQYHPDINPNVSENEKLLKTELFQLLCNTRDKIKGVWEKVISGEAIEEDDIYASPLATKYGEVLREYNQNLKKYIELLEADIAIRKEMIAVLREAIEAMNKQVEMAKQQGIKSLEIQEKIETREKFHHNVNERLSILESQNPSSSFTIVMKKANSFLRSFLINLTFPPNFFRENKEKINSKNFKHSSEISNLTEIELKTILRQRLERMDTIKNDIRFSHEMFKHNNRVFNKKTDELEKHIQKSDEKQKEIKKRLEILERDAKNPSELDPLWKRIFSFFRDFWTISSQQNSRSSDSFLFVTERQDEDILLQAAKNCDRQYQKIEENFALTAVKSEKIDEEQQMIKERIKILEDQVVSKSFKLSFWSEQPLSQNFHESEPESILTQKISLDNT